MYQGDLVLSSAESYRAYVRTLTFLYTICAERFIRKTRSRNARVLVLHSLDYNLYSEIRVDSQVVILDPKEIELIENDMRDIVRRKAPVNKQNMTLNEAKEIFREKGRPDEERLIHYRSITTVNLYQLDGEWDYFIGPLFADAGKVKWFDLIPYKDGIIIRTPAPDSPNNLRRFVPKPHLFSIFQESREWSRMTCAENVAGLNDAICDGSIEELIQVSEALHARNIASIALKIAGKDVSRTPRKRLVFVAGPSSSGKTTFSQKLCIQLKAEGIRPHLISMDHYFHPRRLVPFLDNGLQDFENITALDTDLFKKDMHALLKGQTVNLPTYNFLTGEREYNGESLRLSDEDCLVVEGIHGLNPIIYDSFERDQIFRIYISAITMLGVDDHNRIPSTDGRLLRRMVRDNLYRGYTAKDTLARWGAVHEGENKYIFPYQEEADVMFNSSHIYELAVLKSYAEPLLFKIGPEDETYPEARRLIKFLSYFLSIGSEQVPRSSLIREFIGGGTYHQ